MNGVTPVTAFPVFEAALGGRTDDLEGLLVEFEYSEDGATWIPAGSAETDGSGVATLTLLTEDSNGDLAWLADGDYEVRATAKEWDPQTGSYATSPTSTGFAVEIDSTAVSTPSFTPTSFSVITNVMGVPDNELTPEAAAMTSDLDTYELLCFTGTVTHDGPVDLLSVEFDWDGDGEVDAWTLTVGEEIETSPGNFVGRFNYIPRGLHFDGDSITFNARIGVPSGRGGYLEDYTMGAWTEQSLTVSCPASTIEDLRILNDTGSSDFDCQTSDPTIQGRVENALGDVAGREVRIEYFNGAAWEHLETVKSDGKGIFIYTPPTSALANPGAYVLRARVVETDDFSGQTIEQADSVLVLTLLDQSENACPEIATVDGGGGTLDLKLLNNTGLPDDNRTVDPTIVGRISNDGNLAGLPVEILLEDPATQETSLIGTAYTDSEGQFLFSPEGLEATAGGTAIKLFVRPCEWDPFNQTTIEPSGDGEAFEFILCETATIEIDEFSVDTSVDEDPTLSGSVECTAADPASVSHVMVQFDYQIEGQKEFDGHADGSVLTDDLGNFTYTPKGLPRNTLIEVKARVLQWDYETGAYMTETLWPEATDDGYLTFTLTGDAPIPDLDQDELESMRSATEDAEDALRDAVDRIVQRNWTSGGGAILLGAGTLRPCYQGDMEGIDADSGEYSAPFQASADATSANVAPADVPNGTFLISETKGDTQISGGYGGNSAYTVTVEDQDGDGVVDTMSVDVYFETSFSYSSSFTNAVDIDGGVRISNVTMDLDDCTYRLDYEATFDNVGTGGNVVWSGTGSLSEEYSYECTYIESVSETVALTGRQTAETRTRTTSVNSHSLYQETNFTLDANADGEQTQQHPFTLSASYVTSETASGSGTQRSVDLDGSSHYDYSYHDDDEYRENIDNAGTYVVNNEFPDGDGTVYAVAVNGHYVADVSAKVESSLAGSSSYNIDTDDGYSESGNGRLSGDASYAFAYKDDCTSYSIHATFDGAGVQTVDAESHGIIVLDESAGISSSDSGGGSFSVLRDGGRTKASGSADYGASVDAHSWLWIMGTYNESAHADADGVTFDDTWSLTVQTSDSLNVELGGQSDADFKVKDQYGRTEGAAGAGFEASTSFSSKTQGNGSYCTDTFVFVSQGVDRSSFSFTSTNNASGSYTFDDGKYAAAGSFGSEGSGTAGSSSNAHYSLHVQDDEFGAQGIVRSNASASASGTSSSTAHYTYVDGDDKYSGSYSNQSVSGFSFSHSNDEMSFHVDNDGVSGNGSYTESLSTSYSSNGSNSGLSKYKVGEGEGANTYKTSYHGTFSGNGNGSSTADVSYSLQKDGNASLTSTFDDRARASSSSEYDYYGSNDDYKYKGNRESTYSRTETDEGTLTISTDEGWEITGGNFTASESSRTDFEYESETTSDEDGATETKHEESGWSTYSLHVAAEYDADERGLTVTADWNPDTPMLTESSAAFHTSETKSKRKSKKLGSAADPEITHDESASESTVETIYRSNVDYAGDFSIDPETGRFDCGERTTRRVFDTEASGKETRDYVYKVQLAPGTSHVEKINSHTKIDWSQEGESVYIIEESIDGSVFVVDFRDEHDESSHTYTEKQRRTVSPDGEMKVTTKSKTKTTGSSHANRYGCDNGSGDERGIYDSHDETKTTFRQTKDTSGAGGNAFTTYSGVRSSKTTNVIDVDGSYSYADGVYSRSDTVDTTNTFKNSLNSTSFTCAGNVLVLTTTNDTGKGKDHNKTVITANEKVLVKSDSNNSRKLKVDTKIVQIAWLGGWSTSASTLKTKNTSDKTTTFGEDGESTGGSTKRSDFSSRHSFGYSRENGSVSGRSKSTGWQSKSVKNGAGSTSSGSRDSAKNTIKYDDGPTVTATISNSTYDWQPINKSSVLDVGLHTASGEATTKKTSVIRAFDSLYRTQSTEKVSYWELAVGQAGIRSETRTISSSLENKSHLSNPPGDNAWADDVKLDKKVELSHSVTHVTVSFGPFSSTSSHTTMSFDSVDDSLWFDEYDSKGLTKTCSVKPSSLSGSDGTGALLYCHTTDEWCDYYYRITGDDWSRTTTHRNVYDPESDDGSPSGGWSPLGGGEVTLDGTASGVAELFHAYSDGESVGSLGNIEAWMAGLDCVYTFDEDGNVASLVDPENNVTSWTYDDDGRPLTETITVDDVEQTRFWHYDSLGRLDRKTDRNGRVTEYDYDAEGRLYHEYWKDESDQTIRTYTYAYDPTTGRLTGVQDSGNPDTGNGVDLSYGYDTDSVAVTWDFLTLNDTITITSTYDTGVRTEETAALGTVDDYKTTYNYDASDRLESVVQEGITGGNTVAAKSAEFGYDAQGRRETITRKEATDVVFETGFDFDETILDRIMGITHTDPDIPDTTLRDYDYLYDDLGRIDSETSDWYTGLVDFGYDEVTGELTSETSQYSGTRTWEYDDNGNRTETYEQTTGTKQYKTDSYNRVACDGYYSYEYDAEGNRIKRYVDDDDSGTLNAGDDDWTEYTWDHRNRLIQVESGGEFGTTDVTVTFGYDYLNRWVSTKVDASPATTGGETSEYLVYNPQAVSDTVSPWDVGATGLDEVGQVVLRLEGEGDFDVDGEETARVANRYLWTPGVDEILADEQVSWDAQAGGGSGACVTDRILWPATDIRGSVCDLVEFDDATDTATVVQHRTYDAFGRHLATYELSGGALVPVTAPTITHLIGFTGRPGEVTTGLQNNLNRWYDASVGSWINEDPIGFEGGDTNLYRYCGNDPVNAADPNGLVTRRSDLMREFGLGSSYGSGLRRDLDNLDTAVAAGTAFTKKFIGDFYVGMGLAAGTTIEGGLETLGAFLEEPLGMTYLTIENAVLAVWNYDETAKKMATGVCDVIKVMGSDNNVAKSQIANQVLFGAMIPGAGKTVMDDLFKGWKQSRAELAAASKAGKLGGEALAAVQSGGVQTPKVGWFDSLKLRWEHRDLIRQLNQGDVAVDAMQVVRTKSSVFGRMGEITAATGREVALIRTEAGLVLRLGTRGRVNVAGATRVIAHTHPSGRLGLSIDDYISVFNHPTRAHRSTIVIGPSGFWRRYTSNQTILGGNF